MEQPNDDPPPYTETQLIQLKRISTAPWLYPFKGIYFFATHSYLWPLVRARLIPCILLSFFVLTTLFIGTYLPQAAFLKIFHPHGPALFNAFFLVLGEGAAITALLFEAFLVDDTLVSVFDATLVAQGHPSLVRTLRPVFDEAPDPVGALGKPHQTQVYSPFSCRQITEFILLLPLNFVPWVGVPLFLYLTGYRAGPLQHHRWFNMKGMGKKEKREWIKGRRGGYTGFGVVSLVLQLVPVLSMLFLITTACGSALWISAIEERRRIEGREGSVEGERYVDEEEV